MPRRFLSTSNDLKLALVYGALILLLMFSVELLFLETPGSGASGGGGGGPDGGGDDDAAIVEEELNVLSVSSQTSETQTSTEDFSLDEQYVYSITVSLTWSDDVGSNDRFEVVLERDGRALGSGRGETGSISFDAVDNEEGGLNGSFTVSITAEECPGALGSHALDRDNGNTWDLRVTAVVGRNVAGGGR